MSLPETLPAPSFAVAVEPANLPSALTLAAIEAGVSTDDAYAYNLGRNVGPTPAQLRAVFEATHPDFRESAPDLRDCRIGADRTRLGDLTALECEALTAALTTPRWVVRYYADPGVRVAQFVEYSKAADFARTRTLYGKPCAVKPIAEAA